MRIKIETIDGRELTFDVQNISDVKVEKDNGMFRELELKDFKWNLDPVEVLDTIDKEDIAEYIHETSRNIPLPREVMFQYFTLSELVDTICDDFDKQPKDIIYDCPVDACWKWEENL